MNAYNIYVDKIREYLLSVDKDLKIVTSEEPLFNRFSGNGFDVETGCMPGSFMMTLISTENRPGSVEVEGVNFDLFTDIFNLMYNERKTSKVV